MILYNEGVIYLEEEKILLTGAGFTHNFGAPLSKGMWSSIFNHAQVQINSRLKSLLLRDVDFESVYHSITEGKYNESEKLAINVAVADAYEKLDSIVKDWGFRSGSPHPVNIYKVQELIDLFSKVNKKSFFFTLNQDLFIERHYYNGQRPIIPGIQHKQEWFSTLLKWPLRRGDYSRVPTREFVEDKIK